MYELIKSYLNKFDCLGIVGDNDCFNILSHEAVKGIKDNKDIQVLLVTNEMSKDRQSYYSSLGLITEIFYG